MLSVVGLVVLVLLAAYVSPIAATAAAAPAEKRTCFEAFAVLVSDGDAGATAGWPSVDPWQAGRALTALISCAMSPVVDPEFTERHAHMVTTARDITQQIFLKSNTTGADCEAPINCASYDDLGWWTFTWLDAYEFAKAFPGNATSNETQTDAGGMVGPEEYLARAERMYAYMRQHGLWDGPTCNDPLGHKGGAMRWATWGSDTQNDYLNAITNGLAMGISARLYRITRNETYRTYFYNHFEWMIMSDLPTIHARDSLPLLQTNEGDNSTITSALPLYVDHYDGKPVSTVDADVLLFRDGVDGRTCKLLLPLFNSEQEFTYNQGMVLTALSEMYRADRNETLLRYAQWIADSSLALFAGGNASATSASMSGNLFPHGDGINTCDGGNTMNPAGKRDTAVQIPQGCGVIKELCESVGGGQYCNAEQYSFKGVLARGIFDLYKVYPQKRYATALTRSVASLWTYARHEVAVTGTLALANKGYSFGLRWANNDAGDENGNMANVATQASAMELIAAAAGVMMTDVVTV